MTIPGNRATSAKIFAAVSITEIGELETGRLANLLDRTVYMSGDWYILLLIMKYACKVRAMEIRT